MRDTRINADVGVFTLHTTLVHLLRATIGFRVASNPRKKFLQVQAIDLRIMLSAQSVKIDSLIKVGKLELNEAVESMCAHLS